MRSDKEIENLMRTAMDSLCNMVNVSMVVGEMTVAPNGSSIIPISKISCGFVAGGGEYGKEKKTSEQGELPFGGGSGAGLSVTPVGFLVSDQIQTRFIPVESALAMERVIEAVPGIIQQFQSIKKEKNKNNLASEPANEPL